jgi:hypothetical protein
MGMTKYGATPEQTSKTASGKPGSYNPPDVKVEQRKDDKNKPKGK